MLQLKSLQTQLETLRIAFDEAINSGKTLGEVRDMYHQIKQVEKLIYQRKIELKRDGLFFEN